MLISSTVAALIAVSTSYSAMVRSLTDRFYSGVSRYSASGFLRIKLGEALEGRGLAPHIFESADEARLDAHQESGSR